MFRSIATAALAVSFAGAAMAEDLTGAKFMAWTTQDRNGFISNAIITSAFIAASTSQEKARCLSDWSSQHLADNYQPIIDAVKKHPQFHPTSVVIAYMEKVCGPLRLALSQ